MSCSYSVVPMGRSEEAEVRQKGFTLAEMMVVVVLLGILAAITIPQFVGASDDAREAALGIDLVNARKQIVLYMVEHNGQGPHMNEREKVDRRRFVERMTGRTDPDGRINSEGICGPYLMQWPANPFCDESVARDVTIGSRRVAPRDGKSGWYFSTATGILTANSTRGAEAYDPESIDPKPKKRRK
jgi:prepilin-type N-terminal cleavage/methylation domain-containing protein